MAPLRDSVRVNEKIVAEIGISKRAIIVEWLAVPAVFLVFFLTVCLPAMIKTLAVDTAKAVFEEAIGIEEAGFSDVALHLWRAVMPAVPDWLVVFVQVLVWMVFLAWAGVTLVRTYLHFGYEMILTETRVLARARGALFDCAWNDVKNVFVEQSLWGRLLKYGSVTVQGPRGSVTVRHVADPKAVQTEFKIRTDTF